MIYVRTARDEKTTKRNTEFYQLQQFKVRKQKCNKPTFFFVDNKPKNSHWFFIKAIKVLFKSYIKYNRPLVTCVNKCMLIANQNRLMKSRNEFDLMNVLKEDQNFIEVRVG